MARDRFGHALTVGDAMFAEIGDRHYPCRLTAVEDRPGDKADPSTMYAGCGPYTVLSVEWEDGTGGVLSPMRVVKLDLDRVWGIGDGVRSKDGKVEGLIEDFRMSTGATWLVIRRGDTGTVMTLPETQVVTFPGPTPDDRTDLFRELERGWDLS